MKKIFLVIVCCFIYSMVNALPFEIIPNSPLPTTVYQGATTTANYKVTNLTNTARYNNFVKYLPPNVTAQNTGCISNFNLAAHGNSGDYCILTLLISGSVDANDPDPRHHLFICFPGGKTCAGTRHSLNISQLPNNIASISITPSSSTITLSETQAFTATALYLDGSSTDVTTSATWDSTNTSAATIDSSGIATGVSTGSTTISATLNGITSNTAALTVARRLTSIAITPTTSTLSASGTQQFTAIGHYNDSTTEDITNDVTWHSSSTSVATINSTGLATAVAGGTTNITATKDGITSNTAVITVSVTLVSFTITPTIPFVNATTQMKATGTYDDGSTADITDTVSWISSDPSVATVDSHGLVTAVTNSGNTTVSASIVTASGTINSTNTPSATAVPLETYAYIMNSNKVFGTNNYMSRCSLNSDFTLSACTSLATAGISFGINGPSGMVFNPAGTKVYFADTSNSTVYVCDVSGGTFSGCTTAKTGLNNAADMAMNKDGTILYVNASSTTDIRYCTLNGDGTLNTCTGTALYPGASSTALFYSPDPSGGSNDLLYIKRSDGVIQDCTLQGSGAVNVCDSNAAGAGNLNFSITVGIARSGLFSPFVSNSGKVYYSVVNDTTGAVGTLTPTGNTLYNPIGPAVNNANTVLYVTTNSSPGNPDLGAVYYCPIDASGAPTTCVNANATNIAKARAIELQ